MLWRFVFIIGLVRLLAITNKPFLCSGIYTALASIFIALSDRPVHHSFIIIVVVFALSSIYFWLLDWLESRGIVWWIVFILGFLIPMI